MTKLTLEIFGCENFEDIAPFIPELKNLKEFKIVFSNKLGYFIVNDEELQRLVTTVQQFPNVNGSN